MEHGLQSLLMGPASSTTQPTDSERTLAALMHIAPILPLGLFITLMIMVIQGKNSPFLMRHGRQALTWQLVQIGITAIATAIYMPFYFRAFFRMMPAAGARRGEVPDMAGFEQIFAMQFAMLGGMMCVLGLFLIVGLLQAIKALKGEVATYPVIGAAVERLLTATKS